MKVTIEAFETYPAGIYPVTVREITLDEESQYGAQFRFKFELGGELSGKTITGWCRQSGSVKSKFFEWYSALTGTAPKPGEAVDTDMLIGRTAVAVVKVKPRDDGTTKNVIDSLMPMNGSAPHTSSQPIDRDTAKADWNAAANAAKAGGMTAEVEKFRPANGATVAEIVAATTLLKTEIKKKTVPIEDDLA